MNNDRFKFRVWDKTAKCYGHLACLVPDGGSEKLISVARPGFEDRYVIEQCTGLRDKNGQLIYEGDIVRCLYGHRYWTYTIRYDPKLAGLYYYAGDEEGSESFDVFYFEEKEIVGNIHEPKWGIVK